MTDKKIAEIGESFVIGNNIPWVKKAVKNIKMYQAVLDYLADSYTLVIVNDFKEIIGR